MATIAWTSNTVPGSLSVTGIAADTSARVSNADGRCPRCERHRWEYQCPGVTPGTHIALTLRGTATATANNSAALTVAVPAGVVAGDLLVMFGAAAGVTLSGVTGFSGSANTVAGDVNARAYIRVADGTETTFPITLSAATSVGAAICAAYSGPASIDPRSVPAPYVTATAGTPVAVPGVALTGQQDWLAWFGAGLGTGTTSFTITPPAGFTAQATVAEFNNGTVEAALVFADLESAQPSGATGVQTGALSGAHHAAGWLVGINSGFLDFF